MLLSKMYAVVLLNQNFVGNCNFTDSGDKYLEIHSKRGVEYSMIDGIFKNGYVVIDGQIIPTSCIGSIYLVEEQ